MQCYTLRDVLDVVTRQAAKECGDEHAVCGLCILVPLCVYAFGFTWEDVVDWRIPLQKIDTGKRSEKIHGRVCRMKKRLPSWWLMDSLIHTRVICY